MNMYTVVWKELIVKKNCGLNHKVFSHEKFISYKLINETDFLSYDIVKVLYEEGNCSCTVIIHID